MNEGTFSIYKSSAGSGKTYTLARFYIALCLKSDNYDYFQRILAITFTVKAAAEMKERILRFLSSLSTHKGDNVETAELMSQLSSQTGLTDATIVERSTKILQRIIHRYDDMSVMTIDSFMHKVIRNFTTDLKISADFDVEIDAQSIRHNITQRVLSEIGKNELLTQVALEFATEQIDQDHSWDIDGAILETLKEIDTEEFLLNVGQSETGKNIDLLGAKQYIKKRIHNFETRIAEVGKEALSLLDQYSVSSQDLFQGTRGIYGYFLAAQSSELSKLQYPNSYVNKTITEEKWQSKSMHPSLPLISSQLAGFFKQIQTLLHELPEVLLLKAILLSLHKSALIHELKKAQESYKSENNVLTILDFYRLIHDQIILEDAEFIFERLGTRINHVLIDEFQDTSIMQWHSLKPILENALSEGNSCLIVGDLKQSVYRFRGSAPELFETINKPGANNHLMASLGEEIALSDNYRSSPGIVRFNNRFFNEFASTLDSNGMSNHFNQIEQNAKRNTSFFIQLKALEANNRQDAIEEYANYLLVRIGEILQEGKFNPGDLCLLFRRNDEAAFVASKLLSEGISVISDDSLRLHSNPEVRLILSSLKVLRWPNNTFNIQEWLARMQQCKLLSISHYSAAIDQIQHHKNFFATLNSLGLDTSKFPKDSVKPFQLIHDLCSFFDISTSNAFVSKLLDVAKEFELNRSYFHSEFLSHIDNVLESLCISPESSANAIRVMTIHKSKGLEFPAVFVYLPSFEPHRPTRSNAWIPVSAIVPGLNTALVAIQHLKDSSMNHVYSEEVFRSKFDALNALYVAFTRAERHLECIMIGADGEPKDPNLKFLSNWLEWDHSTLSMTFQGAS